MDLEKAIRPIWRMMERDLGLTAIPDEARDTLIELAGGEPAIADDIECLKEGLTNMWKGHQVLKRLENSNPLTERSAKVKRGGKHFQRRVYIASFVLFAIYTPPELFIPLIRNEPLPKERINWKRIFNEWNQAHPSDQMTSVSVFTAEFYRILRDKEVLAEILRKEIVETEEFLQLVQSKKGGTK